MNFESANSIITFELNKLIESNNIEDECEIVLLNLIELIKEL